MKKITLFILTIFTVATLFAAARPSLDGRAVVAESGTMPKGLFARTVGYLPGDSVTVTNPATGSTIDVLILGAIDPSEGVAILLSPEAAEGLRIKPESNVQVKLTKRAGSLDENANGSAVLSESTSNETSAPEENETASEPETAETESAPETEVTPKTEEIPAVAENTLSESEAPVVAVEEEPEPVAPLPEKKDEVIEETPVVAENTEPYEEIPVVREPEKKTVPEYEEIPVVAETKPAQKVTGTVYEELPPLPEDEVEKVVVIETEKEEPEKAAAELPALTEEIVSAESEIPTEEAVPVTDAEKLQPVILVETEKVTSEEEDLQPVIEELPVIAENETEQVYEELPEGVESEPAVVAEENAEADAYQPIVLVPAEMNPPEPFEEEKTEEVAKIEPEKAIPEEKPVVSNDWTNYVVPSVRNLRSGYYYVQVASLGNPENIKTLVDKYSAKYPLVLVQNATKTAYQVMVGPLNIDEYGSVDEKFKAYGFKDSFVRKIR